MDRHTHRKTDIAVDYPGGQVTSLDQGEYESAQFAGFRPGSGKFRNCMRCALRLIGPLQHNSSLEKPSKDSGRDDPDADLKRYANFMETKFSQWGRPNAGSSETTASTDDGDDVSDGASVSLSITCSSTSLTF